jgi:hypothetical protein
MGAAKLNTNQTTPRQHNASLRSAPPRRQQIVATARKHMNRGDTHQTVNE